jgi:DNA-binding winged helix-turn-helix (wHTH) protein
LDTDRRELHRGGVVVRVEPQVFDLLQHLIRHRERVVSKDELLAEVWHGRIVSEATLSSRINAARSALGDNGEQQRLIRTVPRKGFRFIGGVREQERAQRRSSPPNSKLPIVRRRPRSRPPHQSGLWAQLSIKPASAAVGMITRATITRLGFSSNFCAM